MITIYFWSKLFPTEVGRPCECASLQVGRNYVSWAPERSQASDLSTAPPLAADAASDAILSSSEVDNETDRFDQAKQLGEGVAIVESAECLEDGEGNSEAAIGSNSVDQDRAFMGRSEDFRIQLFGLDENRISRWWRSVSHTIASENTAKDCLSTIAEALQIAGAEDFAKVRCSRRKGATETWNTVDLLRYACQIREGLELYRNENRAIHFVRRYCHGPEALCVSTANLDQERMVEDIFTELSRDSELVYQVLRVLEEYRSSDMDVLVEQLAYIIRRRGGMPRLAVAKHGGIKYLLLSHLNYRVGGRYLANRAYSYDFFLKL